MINLSIRKIIRLNVYISLRQKIKYGRGEKQIKKECQGSMTEKMKGLERKQCPSGGWERQQTQPNTTVFHLDSGKETM